MDLFDIAAKNDGSENKNVPLAERMRARSLSEFLGQEHIVSGTGLLRRAIKSDRLGSCIFGVRQNHARKRRGKQHGGEFR